MKTAVFNGLRRHKPEYTGNSRWPAMLLSWLITLACLTFIVLLVPVREVWSAIRLATPGWLLIAMLPVIANISMRGLRFEHLLRAKNERQVLKAAAVCAAGLGLNATLPGKVGELARIGLSVSVLKVKATTAAMAIILERGLDLAVLACGGFLALMGLAGMGVLQNNVHFEALAMTMASLSGAFLLFVLLVSNRRLARLVDRAMSRFAPESAWPRKIRQFTQEIGLGARRFLRPRTAIITTLITVVIWSLLGLGAYVVSLAMPGVECSLLAALVFSFITILASALPSAPGAWGVYEAAGIAAGSVLVSHDSLAALTAFVFVTHAVQYVPVVLMGLASWNRLAAMGYRLVEPSDKKMVTGEDGD